MEQLEVNALSESAVRSDISLRSWRRKNSLRFDLTDKNNFLFLLVTSFV